MIKEIPGFPHYFADELGNIYSVKTTHSHHGYFLGEPRVMMQAKNSQGYKIVKIYADGKARNITVHLLVLKTFVSDRPVGMQGCHGKNGISDNSVTNLYWATPKQNNADKYRDGTEQTGENHPYHKLTEKQVREIRQKYGYRNKNGLSSTKLAKIYCVEKSTITDIIRRYTWKHI